jgi:hypothetical protein
VKNLADGPKRAKVLEQLRRRLEEWIEETGDPSPETPAIYVMGTEDRMKSTSNPASRENYRKNSELYKRRPSESK